MDTTTGGLRVEVVANADALVDATARWLGGCAPDPFALATICVPDPGAGRWLAQQLARRLGSVAGDGVCAGVTFTTLRSWYAQFERTVTGTDRGEDAWQPGRLAWVLLDELEAARDEQWIRQVWQHISGPQAPPGARLATARRIAGLFHRYAADAPDMLDAWRDGADVGPCGDDLAMFCDGTYAWQPALWRRVRERLAATNGLDPVERLSTISPEELAAAAPERLLVVSPGPLGQRRRRLLERVFTTCAVTALLPASSPSSDLLSQRLGHVGRQAVTDWTSLQGASVGPLQTRDDAPLRVVVHASHGPDRQVEVLRDALLGTMANDPTLEPRDVVIFCPDIDTYAPLITAAFAPAPDDDTEINPGHHLRVRLADRSGATLNPVMAALVSILDAAAGRMGRCDVMDVLSQPAIAQRFGFFGDRLIRLDMLIQSAGIRWGLDARQRVEEGVPDVDANTWRQGLDRLVLGVAMGEDGLPSVAGVLPYDDVESESVELVGALADVMARLQRFWALGSEPHPASTWLGEAFTLIDTLMTEQPDEPWQLGHALGTLADIADRCADAQTPITLAEFRVLLKSELSSRPGRSSFGTGATVVCPPGQLTGVPHRVVCLLGFDASVFPRVDVIDGDDLLAGCSSATGPRARDRQALLDAVNAATQELLIVYRGHDPVTNAEVAPSIPLAEVIAAMPQAVVEHHPLQPFAPENFDATLPEPHTLSYDLPSLRGARSLVGPTIVDPDAYALDAPAPRLIPESITLTELTRFLAHPARRFLGLRAGLYGDDDRDRPPPDEIPLQLSNLDKWAIGDRLLDLVLSGEPLSRVLEAERRRGTLPPAELGAADAAQIAHEVDDIATAARPLLDGEVIDHEIAVEVSLAATDGAPSPRILVTGNVRTVDGAIVDVSYSRVGSRQRLAGWVRLLALGTAEPGAWRWVGLGKGSRAQFGPVPRTWNSAGLTNLVDLYVRGLETPLPLPLRTSERYASLVLQGFDTTQPSLPSALDRSWGYDADAVWSRFFPTLPALLATVPDPDDSRHYSEPSRFGTLARRVWEPLLRVERGGERR